MEESVLLLLIKSGTAYQYNQYVDNLRKKFRLVIKTDENLNGTEQTLAFGTTYLLEKFGVDYVTWMGDDALFHPLWLWKLEGLIRRHPQAKAWNVYRSAFEWVHRSFKEEGEDVLVRSVCGHGMTFTKKEWLDWGMTADKARLYGTEGNSTLDLEHMEQRPGERWVTKTSFVEHTGKVGVHCTEHIPEYARDFVGTI